MQAKRMHPMKILFSIFNLLRNTIFIPFYLFIIKFNDGSTGITIARIAFPCLLVICIIFIFIEWWKTTYEWKAGSIHIHRGLFIKKNSIVPLQHVQDIQWDTPFFYKLFDLTALTLETSATDEDASVKFKPIKRKDALWMEQQLQADQQAIPEPAQTNDIDISSTNQKDDRQQTIHFQPTRGNLLKASFLSFSFLAIIPILAFFYRKMDNILSLDEKAKHLLAFLTRSWVITSMAISLFVMVAIAIGMIRTFLKYGKYKIASDQAHIYIHNGIFNERKFSIRKESVQAIQVTQTPLKRLAGLAEVKLISAGTDSKDDEAISSLFPFIPSNQAYRLIEELLPDFKLEQTMFKLPRKALYIRMLRLPWFWIIATILIVWLKPEWAYASPILFVFTYLLRFVAYRNSRFLLNNEFIQFKTGGLWSELFVTKRKKVIEVEVERSLLQKKLGLATIQTANRAKPVHLKQLKDISFDVSETFLSWYEERHHEVELEQK